VNHIPLFQDPAQILILHGVEWSAPGGVLALLRGPDFVLGMPVGRPPGFHAPRSPSPLTGTDFACP
jgi:hypothetical protein